MARMKRCLKPVAQVLSVIVGSIGIWILVFLSFIPGLFFVILGLLIFIAVRRGPPGERVKSTRSFWTFDRTEKGKWEDADRVIRR
ncbi:MAG: hypothetical protein ACTSX2_09965 [Candidatus Thorarchaeota archaeon]